MRAAPRKAALRLLCVVVSVRQVTRFHLATSGAPDHPSTWTVYRCLYCEIDDGATDTFLLYDGKWYRITRDFVETTNRQVRSFAVPSTLPVFDLALYATEGEYNEAVAAAQPKLLLLDRDNIFHGGSHNQIEFCDLFDRDRRFIHVKRYSGSATLSHLFKCGHRSWRRRWRRGPPAPEPVAAFVVGLSSAHRRPSTLTRSDPGLLARNDPLT
jgi:uncharacterized protein (TIGR04141 family)